MQNLSYTLLLIVLPHISTLPDTIMDRNILKETAVKCPDLLKKFILQVDRKLLKELF